MAMNEEPKTVPAYVVLAKASDGAEHEIALFFKVTDVDHFLAELGVGRWTGTRIETRALPVADVHPAHQGLFPKHFPKAATK